MFVTHLSLADFRSWSLAELEFGPGVTTLTGRNGQGKTNIVEAIEFLATLGSHRVSSDVPLIRFGSERAIVRGRVQAGLDDPRQLEQLRQLGCKMVQGYLYAKPMPIEA